MNEDYNKKRIEEILAFNILNRMEETGVTIPQLAEACEVTPTNIRLLIQGEQFVGSRVFACICNTLKTTPAELFKERSNEEAIS